MKLNSFFRPAFAVAVVLASVTLRAHAAIVAVPTPEIDPSLAVSGLGLVAGLAMIVRGRRK